MNNDVRNIDFTTLLPPPLQNNAKMLMLGKVIANELQKNIVLARQSILYARIDELDEAVLDVLAYDLHVDWWDDNYTLEEKRQTLRDSVRIHRALGTKFAVEAALAPVYPGVTVLEWFEYGGEPYRFRILIDIAYENADPAKHQRVLDRVAFYKNMRSHLDGISYYISSAEGCCGYAGVTFSGVGFQITAEVTMHGLE